MTNHTVKQSQAQGKALVKVLRDAAFQRFMFAVMNATRNPGQRFDRAAVEGVRHA